MRRIDVRRAGAPAIALSLFLAGCGGGSGGGDEVPVVDMRDPAFGGPQAAAPGGGGPPAAAPPAAPAAAPGAPQGSPVAGAPIGFSPDGGRDEPAGGPASGSPIASRPGDAGDASDSPASPIAGGGLTASSDGGPAGNSALNEMLAAANAANDPDAARGRTEGAGAGAAPGSSPDAFGMMGGQPPGLPGGGLAPPGYEMSQEYGMSPPPGLGGPPGVGDFGMPDNFGPGGFDQASGASDPADFETPRGAVEAFLDAIEARDLQGLNEATALRAPREAETADRRRVFQAIREMSLTDAELDAIATSFEDFQIAQMARPTAAGIVSFILRKQGDYGSTLQRRVDVRKERSGWKVNDVTGVSEIKRPGGRAMEQRFNRNRDRNDPQGSRP